MIDPSAFVVHRENIPFLNGEKPYPKSVIKGFEFGCGFIFLIPFLFISFFLIGTIINTVRGHILLTQNSVVVTGWVTSRYTDSDEDGITYWLAYQFYVADVTYTGRQAVSEDLYNQYPDGSPIKIIYAVDDPTVSRPNEHNQAGLDIFISIFGVIWTSVAVFATAQLFKARAKYKRLKLTAKTIYGRITHINSWTDSDSDYQIELEVTLRTPDTAEIITGKKKYICNHLSAKPLPNAGTLVYVFYADKTNWEVL